MEKIEISTEKRNELIEGFKKMKSVGMVFLIIGLVGVVPIFPVMFGLLDTTASYGFPTIGFLFIGILYLSQADMAIKKINQGDIDVYKTRCIRKRFFNEYAVVENNDIISKKVRKPEKGIMIIGSTKLIQAEDEIGIVKFDKNSIYAFSLKS